tara:strand:- start:2 stop:1195 length:1194 start_codon:yes stop_codon:yes gene_type:complete
MLVPHLISNRAIALKPSLTLAISAKAKALKDQGKNICSLSAGEPNFNTPSFITQAAINALNKGETRYGPAAGDPILREAIALKLSKINRISTKAENVLVTNGGKQAIFNLMQVLLNPGDEVIILSPYWLSYPEIVSLTGAKSIIIKSDPKKDFSTDLNKLEHSINSKTKLLIINSPCNPTGKVMKENEQKSIASIVRKHPNLNVMSDEIYEYLLSNSANHVSFASIAPDLSDRIFTVNGFAKGWAMTGWRIGYLAGNKDIIDAAIALQSQSTSNVCSFAQKGALAAITASLECVKEMANEYNTRRDILIKGLHQIEGMFLSSPEGAFYAFPCLPKDSPNSIKFCELALDKVGLAVVPGAAFGEDRCIRISCAASIETIKDGLERLNHLITLVESNSI